MKILIVSDAWHPQVNGVVRTYEHLVDELLKIGHDVRVISPADFPHCFPLPGYKEIMVTFRPSRRLHTMINLYDPDHIHIATEGPLGWAARRYAISRQCEFSTSYHTHFPDYLAARAAKPGSLLYKAVHGFIKTLLRRFHAPSAALMVATGSLEEELRNWKFRNPIFQFSRGVDLALYHPGEKTLFNSLRRPVALYVGRVAVEKNVENFLAMPWAGDKVVVGDGPSLAALAGKYRDVHFTGKLAGANLAAHYRSADIFVFPSRTDTFGMVLIEALASGLPVAAYPVRGPKDIVTEPFLGVLSDNLAEAAEKALSCGTPEQRARHSYEHYSWEKAARQFESVAASLSAASPTN